MWPGFKKRDFSVDQVRMGVKVVVVPVVRGGLIFEVVKEHDGHEGPQWTRGLMLVMIFVNS
jgi:hypothetical protein